MDKLKTFKELRKGDYLYIFDSNGFVFTKVKITGTLRKGTDEVTLYFKRNDRAVYDSDCELTLKYNKLNHSVTTVRTKDWNRVTVFSTEYSSNFQRRLKSAISDIVTRCYVLLRADSYKDRF